MDKKIQFNQLLNELKEILKDFDNVLYRDDPEVRIKGEGVKVKEYSDGKTTPYEKLMTRLDIFCREYDENVRQKKNSA